MTGPNETEARPAEEDRPRFSIAMDKDTPPHLQIKLAKLEYRYATLGLVVGLIGILGGILLFLNGVLGSTSWTANLLGAESQISDAAPGALLFVVGLLVVIATRPKVRHLHNPRDRDA